MKLHTLNCRCVDCVVVGTLFQALLAHCRDVERVDSVAWASTVIQMAGAVAAATHKGRGIDTGEALRLFQRAMDFCLEADAANPTEGEA